MSVGASMLLAPASIARLNTASTSSVYNISELRAALAARRHGAALGVFVREHHHRIADLDFGVHDAAFGPGIRTVSCAPNTFV